MGKRIDAHWPNLTSGVPDLKFYFFLNFSFSKDDNIKSCIENISRVMISVSYYNQCGTFI